MKKFLCVVVISIGLLINAFAQPSVDATTTGINGGGTVFAPCTEILRFDNYNDALAESATGQDFVFTLASGDSLFIHLTSTGGAMNAVAAPSWTGASLGQFGYTGLTGNIVLYKASSGTNTTLLFDSITLKDRYGNLVTDFTMIGLDGEATQLTEATTLTTLAGLNWYNWDSIVPPPTFGSPTQTGIGTNVVKWTGATFIGNTKAYSDAVNSPPFISALLKGEQGFTIGIRRKIVAVPDTACSGGTINIIPVNAPTGTTYTWPMPVITPAGSITGATAQAAATGTITQTLALTGAGPATAVYTITPTSCGLPDSPFIATVLLGIGTPIVNLGNDTILCTGQSLLLNAANANSTYHWQDGSGNAAYNVTSAGTYSVTVTGASGCSASGSVTVSYNSPPPGFNIGNDTSYCGNFIRVLSTGLAGTVWSTGITAQQITVTTPGIYWAQITYACGIAADTITITQNPVPVASLGNDTILCSGQTDLLNATNANSTYRWQDASVNATYNVTAAGNYSVTVTTTSSCSASASVTVSYNSPPPPFTLGNDTSYCGNFSRVLSTGVAGTVWSTGVTAPQITVNATGDYWAQITNTCGVAADTINIVQNPVPVVGLPNDTATCSPSLTLNVAVAGGTYLWQDGTTLPTYTVTVTGPYSVTVTAAGCSGSGSVNVVMNAALVITVTPADTLICAGDSTPLCAPAGYGTYSWSSGENTVCMIAIQAGTYVVSVTDGTSGCTATASAIVNTSTPITDTYTATPIQCFGQSSGAINLVTSGGTAPYTYQWSNGDTLQNISNIPTGSYSVTITDNANCATVVAPVNIPTPTAISLALSVTNETCTNADNGSIVANATGGTIPYSYAWSNGLSTQNIGGLSPGNYVITMSDSNGCLDSISANITVQSMMGFSATVQNPVCPAVNNGSIALNITGNSSPYQFVWSGNMQTQNVYNLSPGTYSVTITNVFGCQTDTAFTLAYLYTLTLAVSPDVTITLGIDTLLIATANQNQLTYSWSPAAGLGCSNCDSTIASPIVTTNYTVTAEDDSGCIATASVTVTVLPDHTLFIPNVFTPGNSGNNNYFQIYGNKVALRYLSVQIFDRWGEKVFDSTDPDFKWDGVYKGQALPSGVYTYQVKTVFADGNTPKLYTGGITLLR